MIEKMQDEIKARRKRAFSWGSHDCCKAANALIYAQHRVSLMADLPRYSSLKGAVALVKALEAETLGELIARLATEKGFEEIPIAQAKRGDLVILPWPSAEHDILKHAPGIVVGSSAVFAGAVGWSHIPVEQASKAFRICPKS